MVLVPLLFPEDLWNTVGFEASLLTTNRYTIGRIPYVSWDYYDKFAGAFHWVLKTETVKQLR